MIKQLWGTLVCKVLGKHKRGKKFGSRQLDKTANDGRGTWAVIYQCGRCGAKWERKEKAKEPK